MQPTAGSATLGSSLVGNRHWRAKPTVGSAEALSRLLTDIRRVEPTVGDLSGAACCPDHS